VGVEEWGNAEPRGTTPRPNPPPQRGEGGAAARHSLASMRATFVVALLLNTTNGATTRAAPTADDVGERCYYAYRSDAIYRAAILRLSYVKTKSWSACGRWQVKHEVKFAFGLGVLSGRNAWYSQSPLRTTSG
jgi:hypothetical protein